MTLIMSPTRDPPAERLNVEAQTAKEWDFCLPVWQKHGAAWQGHFDQRRRFGA